MRLDAAIERHRKPLLRIVATMFAMIGLSQGEPVERLTPSIYRAVLRLLVPAESAVRRLIMVAARGLVMPPPRIRTACRTVAPAVRKTQTRTTFRLFDPRKRFTSAFAFERPRVRILAKPVVRPEPRLHVLDVGFDPRVPLFRQPPPIVKEPAPAPLPDGTVSAIRICRRLAAIKSALDDLPRQARRYARWQARPGDKRRPNVSSALRPGLPPGHRRNPRHKVDDILAECDWLARHPPKADTS